MLTKPEDKPQQRQIESVVGRFFVSSVVIKDPSSVYSQTIDLSVPNSSAALQFVIPLNINDDNLSDFIVHYWRNPSFDEFGNMDTVDVQDALVGLVSQPNGTYITDNLSVFGADIAQLGSASRKYVTGDLNGDGVDDYAFAMNNEDGRSAENADTIESFPAVILSSGKGSYSPQNVGVASWGHAVDLIENPVGGYDAAFAGLINDGRFQAYRWDSNQFQDVSEAYPAVSLTREWGSTFRFFEATSAGTGSTEALGFSNNGIGLYQRDEFGNWELADHWSSEPMFQVDFITWSDDLGITDVVEFNGSQYLDGNIEEIAIFENPTTQQEFILGKLALLQIPGVERYDRNTTYDQDDAIPVNTFVFFDRVGSELRQIDSPIVHETIEVNYNFFDYMDVNSDGVYDIIAYAFTRPFFKERIDEAGKPIIYLGIEDGSFVQVDLSNLPGHSAINDGAEYQSLMTDVNSDGIVDLMLFGSTGSTFGGNNGDLEIHFLGENAINIDRQIHEQGFSAFDLDGSAGQTAKTLAAVIGADGLSNKEYVGIGLQLFDAGQSLASVCELALNAVGATTHTDVVNLLYTNLFGEAPTEAQAQEYVSALDAGVFTKGSLAAAAAELTDDLGVIDLVGLAETGIEYV